MVDSGRYDAVLMDIQMPEMDGYEATARIRAKLQQASLPVIAMTAHAVAGFRENSLAMGMNDYVTKPIDPERLFGVLASWIRLDPERVVVAAPTAAQDAAPNVPGVDMQDAMARLGGNGQLVTILLNKFAREFEATPQHLLEAIDSGDFEEASVLVHKIRGAAGNLSMAELHRAAGGLENLLLPPRLAQLDEALAAFGAALETVIDGVHALDGVAQH
jgi:CheY-like chemotaxis protein